MLSFKDKVECLEKKLDLVISDYVDGLTNDISMYFADFNIENECLFFLKELISEKEIIDWVDKLISRIIMKFDNDYESINDFIYDYIKFG